MSASKRRYVIIGGGAAGMAATTAIREQDRLGSIVVISEEQDMPYFRPMIPFLISGKKAEADMALAGRGPYQAEGIHIRTGVRVIRVEPEAHQVYVTGGEKVPYDKLLIASGSLPNIPADIKGVEAEGVFALRTLDDARKAALRAKKGGHVIMLGGGMLNLKTAFSLLERGLDVSLVVHSPQVLSQLMEPEDAALIRKALDMAGLKILTGCNAERIISDKDGVTSVALTNGMEIPCRMVFIGKGVLPNVDFLSNGPVHIDHGVVVNQYTATNVPDIHAAGDVAATFDPATGKMIVAGLWTNAVEMGRCAGNNMAGNVTRYGGAFGIQNATQVADVPFVSMGVVHTKGNDFETHTAESYGSYRRLVFSPDGTRLAGAVFVRDISRAGLYRFLIREAMDIGRIKAQIIDHKLHYGHFVCSPLAKGG